MAKENDWDASWLDRIAESLAGIKYGSVQIVIHDGKIVQIERTEKRRYDHTDSIHHPTQQKQG